jgi:hypothetical protein
MFQQRIGQLIKSKIGQCRLVVKRAQKYYVIMRLMGVSYSLAHKMKIKFGPARKLISALSSTSQGITLTRFPRVKAPPPSSARPLVVYVPNFVDKEVHQHLVSGHIVVSKDRGEIGTEYLVPFLRLPEGNLIVAFAQCKFVYKKTSWIDIKNKLDASMEKVKASNNELFAVEMFPVVHTTVDQVRIQNYQSVLSFFFFLSFSFFLSFFLSIFLFLSFLLFKPNLWKIAYTIQKMTFSTVRIS